MNEVRIRETIFPGTTTIRVVEKVLAAETKSEKVVLREEMSPTTLMAGFDDLANAKMKLAEANITIHKQLNDNTLLLACAEGESLEALALRIGDIHSSFIEPNWVVRNQLMPNDTYFPQLWAMSNSGQNGGTVDADIDADEAWDLVTGNPALTVAVIDTGIDYGHPDLAPNMWRNPDESGTDSNGNDKRTNGIDDDGNGYVDDVFGFDFVNDDNDPLDDNLHGTHCAGTIGASGNNGLGVTGVCWNVSLMALKFLDELGSGYTSDAILSIEYARSKGAKVLSNSWGGGIYSIALNNAIRTTDSAGILFVAAAGNDSSNNDISHSYPASYDVANVVSVLATDHRDLRATFSNFGANTVDLGAPGVNILSTFPTSITFEMQNRGYSVNYGTISGTSMATPHVAGAAALLWSHSPGMTVAQIKERLLTSADRKTSLSTFSISGGRLNVNNALRNITTPIQAARITQPPQYAECGPTIAIMGTAVAGDLVNYTIEVGAGTNPTTWSTQGITLVGGGMQSVQDGKLADWNTGGTVSGTWMIRLTLNFSSGSRTDLRQVSVFPNFKPGFPLYAVSTSGSFYSGPHAMGVVVADLENDGKKEILATSTATGPLYAWNHRGDLLPGWPLSYSGVTYPAAADMDNDGLLEIGTNFCVQDGNFGVINKAGHFRQGWPRYLRNFGSTMPTLVDVDGNGVKDIIVNEESRDVSIYQLDGTPLPGWPRSVANSQRALSVVVGDLDGDGYNEVFAMDCMTSANKLIYGWRYDGTPLPGWPLDLWMDGSSGNGLALGDIDHDGSLELIAPLNSPSTAKVFAFKANGSQLPGFPVTLAEPYALSPPALADLNNDGRLEIIFAQMRSGQSCQMHVVRSDGTHYPGWPQIAPPSMTLLSSFSPVVGDIDGDGGQDIVMGFQFNGHIMAWRSTGQPVAGMPVRIEMGGGGCPAIADIDGDGRNEVLAFSDNWTGHSGLAARVYAWDFNAPGTASGPIEWDQLRGGAAHTGLYKGTPVNLRPLARDRMIHTPVNSPSIPVTLEAWDDQRMPLTFTILSLPSVGTISGVAPNLTYAPPAGFRGSAILTFKANDGVQDSRVATVTIIVNDAPTVSSLQLTTPEDTPLPFTLLGQDLNDDVLTYTIVTPPLRGTLSGTGNSRLYTPNADFSGTDSFTYKAFDGLLESVITSVSLTITPVNDAPVASNLTMHAPMNTASVGFTLYATDKENNPLSFSVLMPPAVGTITGTPPNLTYNPPAGYFGIQTITYKAHDGSLDSNVATCTIKIYNTQPPQVANLQFQSNEDTPVVVQFAGIDPNNGTLSYDPWTPTSGTLTAGADVSQRIFTPTENFSGVVTFNYSAWNGYYRSNTATVTIQVNAVNDAPRTLPDVRVTTPGEAVTFTNVLANDFDIEGDAFSLIEFSAPQFGTMSNLTSTGLTYTPSAGFRAVDTFTYTVQDVHGAVSIGTMAVVMLSPEVVGNWPMMGNNPAHTSYVDKTLPPQQLVEDWGVQLSVAALKQVAVSDGLVVAVAQTTTAYPRTLQYVALEATTGFEVWRNVAGPFEYFSPPSAVNGRVYASYVDSSRPQTERMQVRSWSATSGAEVWAKGFGAQWSNYYSPVVTNSNVYLVGGQYDALMGLDIATGTAVFSTQFDQINNWAPSVYQGRLFTWLNCKLREHNTMTGAELWVKAFPPSPFSTGNGNTVITFADQRAIVAEGNSNYPSTTLKLRAIDLNTRNEVWNASGLYLGSPAVGGNVVYIINKDRVDAHQVSDGQLIRSYQADNTLLWQPIVTNNALFVSTATTTFVFDIATGVLRQTIPYGGLLSLAGQRLYIATPSGRIQTYTIPKPNNMPVVSGVTATPNPVTIPALCELSVSAFDLDGAPLTYTWSQLSGPGTVTFGASNGTTTGNNCTASFSTAGTYEIQIVVSDGQLSNSSQVTVIVNAPPQFTSSPQAWPNPAVAGESILVSASATDFEGDALTYTWDFADGSPTQTGASISHIYITAGKFNASVTVSDGTATVTQHILIQVEYPAGLLAEFFDWTTSLSTIPSLTGRSADIIRTDNQINYSSVSTAWAGLPAQFSDTFVTRHSGFLKVATPGQYTLFISSDDGSKVYLNGALLINNDGLHGMVEKSATVTLAAGYHPIRVEFFEQGGGAGLIFSWSGPGIAKQVVPAAALCQAARTASSILLTPGSVVLPINGTQQFSATVLDQYGLVKQGANVQWSTNGGGTLTETGFFTATTAGSFTVSASFGATVATAMVQVQAYSTGLLAEFFDYTIPLANVPKLSGLTPGLSRIDAQINYQSTSGAWPGLGSQFIDTFACRHTGKLKITTAGSYTLFIRSDDGSKLYVNDVMVVNNDGLHGMAEKSTTLVLDVGYHDIRTEFFENTGGAGFTFSWSGPGIAKQVVPASALWRIVP